MTKTVIIFPTAKEAEFFGAHGIPVHVCGVGMAECAAATARIIADETPGLIILAGIAGTYTDRFAVGDTVAVASETVADLGRLSDGRFGKLFQKTYDATALPDGLEAVKSNTVNCAGAITAMLPEAGIENMEGAAFFAVCAQFGIPAMEVRTVSNRVGEPVSARNLALATHRLALALENFISVG